MEIILQLLLIIVGCIVLVFLFFVTLLLGWLGLLLCWIFPGLEMGQGGDHNPIEILAWAASILYPSLGALWLVLWGFFGGRELPPFLKGIAWLFPHPAARAVKRGTQRSLSKQVSGTKLASALREEPGTAVGRRIQKYQAGKLKKELDAETAWLRGQESVARSAIDTERTRARASELQKRSEKGE